MTKTEVEKLMIGLFQECQSTRESGQKEYAHDEDNAFANFERIAKQLKMDRKQVLWTYAFKHIDGIVAAINGHVSQREPARGRIKDLIVYLCLLEGMFQEDAANIPIAIYDDWAGETVVNRKNKHE